jgi:carboxymethylenebutenolidase
VLILHSWWGLTAEVKDFAERVADLGYTVVAPDLLDGARPTTQEEGEAALGEVSPDDLSALILSADHTLRAVSVDETQPIAVIGFSMGGSMALWLAARLPQSVSAVVSFYGTQSIDFDDAMAEFQGHFGSDDHMVTEEDRIVTESFIRMGDNQTEFHLYEGAGHWFFEPGEHHDPAAAELAWERTVDFLTRIVPPATPPDRA